MAAPLLLATPASAAPAFQVPFPCGQVWEGQTRYEHRPRNSVDFNRLDDLNDPVVVSAPGVVKTVRNLGSESYGRYVVVDHGSGWSTLYAHLSSFFVSEGQRVSSGARLGSVGSTGGSSGPHLHYEQLLNGSAQRAVFNGTTALYYGSRNYTSRNACGTGDSSSVPTARSYPVRATLDGRTAKDLNNHAVPNKYLEGTRVVVVCQSSGGATYGGSTIWDLTEDGLWIPDYYVGTGYSGFSPTIPRCTVPKSYTVTATLDGRTNKSLTNHAYPNRYPVGSTIKVKCQAYGQRTYNGSYLWDRTTDDLWVPDYYVKTGTNGLVAGLPRCDVDPPTSTSATRLAASDRRVSMAGASFVAKYERFVATPYNDAAGHCTIGYGHLIHRGGCTSSDHESWGAINPDRGLAILWSDLDRAAGGLRSSVGSTPLHQHEFDAVMSLTFNVGIGTFNTTNVRADLVASPPNYSAVPNHMLSIVYAGGQKLCGLYRRRIDEGNMFRSAVYARTYPTCPTGYV